METILTRVGFCPDCCRADRPRTDNFFVAMGSTGWHVMVAKRIGKPGYVPTLYRLIKALGENVIYEKLCGMHDCGVEVFYNSTTDRYNFHLGKWERGVMTTKNWNSLQAYKHDLDFEV